LSDQILKIAAETAQTLKVDRALLVGITAVAFMTLQQTGASAFNVPGKVHIDQKHARLSPEQVPA
jgi:hypothetical protein